MSVRKYKVSPTLKSKLQYATEHIIARCDNKQLTARDAKALENYSDQRCLSLNQLRSDSLDFLNGWSELWDLQINSCKIRDYGALKNHKELRHLWFNGLRAKSPDLSFMSDLTSLESLGVGYVTHLKAFPDLSKCRRLERVTIFNCKSLVDIDAVTKIRNLRSFSIVCTPHDPKDLEDIMGMKTLRTISGAFGSAKKDRVFSEMIAKHGLTYG